MNIAESKTRPNPFKSLNCPVCGEPNPVSKVGSLRCIWCGAPLTKVKVHRNRLRRRETL